MVLALLAGTKTQTRRIMKPQPDWKVAPELRDDWVWKYGEHGDRLWVRETWGYRGAAYGNKTPDTRDVWIEYAADKKKRTIKRPAHDDHGIPKQHIPEGLDEIEVGEWYRKWWASWRPSIFLPRWASRLNLEVIDVRVERLRDISDADAIAEGVTGDGGHAVRGCFVNRGPRDAYFQLFEDINGAGSFAKNPWVWVVEFRRLP